jgi:hypothetical protein
MGGGILTGPLKMQFAFIEHDDMVRSKRKMNLMQNSYQGFALPE